MVMTVENTLKQKIEAAFSPTHLQLENESHMHNVPENSETHFKLLLVSDSFEGMNRVQRQRKVNEVIAEELAGPVHAFSQRVYTSSEWEKAQGDLKFTSPNCLGGSK